LLLPGSEPFRFKTNPLVTAAFAFARGAETTEIAETVETIKTKDKK
jgi:hypothetical protein